MSLRLGFDIGGTFTDFALYDDTNGEVLVGKSLTTPADPSVGALMGLESFLAERALPLVDVKYAVHATTVAANALIERKGARTALVTTHGFRDVLEIGRSKRSSLYDLQVERPQPLVSRALRIGVRERIDASGVVVTPLDEDELRRAARQLADAGVESVAVCFLNAYRNPDHELRAEAVLRDEMGAGVSIALSHALSGRIREYERASTVAASAYVAPTVDRYLASLENGLSGGGYRHGLYVMQSNGGIASVGTARRFPIRIVESGPAAGALVAAVYATASGYSEIVCFDMGGTTAKLCLFEDGKPQFTHTFEVDMKLMAPDSGLPLNIEAIDLVEIGAGGGSIARADHGMLQVGPESAGADPGPICYGLGGDRPTVTDADLVLGYLNAEYFLGGRMTLDTAASEAMVTQQIAEPLRLDLAGAAYGVHRVVNANMEGAARQVTVQRGRDPRDFSMVAFGGAGPVHAAGLARSLGMQRVLVPFGAGVTSAIGLLSAKPKFDLARSYVSPLEPAILEPVNRLFADMTAAATRQLRAAGARQPFIIERSAHMRYEGQGYDIEVRLPGPGELTADDLVTLRQVFDREYATTYGYAEPDAVIKSTDWYLTAIGTWPGLRLSKEAEITGEDAVPVPRSVRPVYFPETGWVQDCPVYDRYLLPPGVSASGPAIVEERESTTVVPPGCAWRIDAYRTLIIELAG